MWKATAEGKEPEAPLRAELDALIDRLDADPDNTELRQKVGVCMFEAHCGRYRGWAVDATITDVRVVDRVRADAWWHGKPPKDSRQAALWLTKAAEKILDGEHPDHTDLPPRDAIDWCMSITARRA